MPRKGEVLPPAVAAVRARVRFWAFVRITGRCWEWQGATGSGGYGQMRVNGRMTRAHRFAYEQTWGDIPPGLHVIHACDNTRCVNPIHLSVGTARDNKQDAMRKGRARVFGAALPGAHCLRGHEFTPANTRTRPDGRRACRACSRDRLRAWRSRTKGAA